MSLVLSPVHGLVACLSVLSSDLACAFGVSHSYAFSGIFVAPSYLSGGHVVWGFLLNVLLPEVGLADLDVAIAVCCNRVVENRI